MPVYQINSYDVDFPHEAYPCQVSCFVCSGSSSCHSTARRGSRLQLLTCVPPFLYLQLAYMEKVLAALDQVRSCCCSTR